MTRDLSAWLDAVIAGPELAPSAERHRDGRFSLQPGKVATTRIANAADFRQDAFAEALEGKRMKLAEQLPILFTGAPAFARMRR
jgi:hypothetical protein